MRLRLPVKVWFGAIRGNAAPEAIHAVAQRSLINPMKRQTPTEGPLPPFVNPTQAAAHAGVAVKTIYRYIENGTLPAVRFGPRCIRIQREDLLALLTPAPEGPRHAVRKTS